MKIPLVLIPGLLSNSVFWKHQIEHLSEIASIYVASPIQDTPEKLVEEILKTAPLQFALAGHSMGGWLSLEIMRRAPSRVSKLCLINTTARSDSDEKAKKRRELIAKAEKGGFEEIAKSLAGRFTFQKEKEKEVETMFLETGLEVFIRQQKAMLMRQESESILPTIFCPALVIHAAEDQNFSLQEHEELKSNIPNAKMAIIEDAGHMSPLEMPQAVTSLLRFWLTQF